jgi:hypothetical protein
MPDLSYQRRGRMPRGRWVARTGTQKDCLWSNFRRNGTTQKRQTLASGGEREVRCDDGVTRLDRRMAVMSVFGASRFSAVLAAVALSGTVGAFWWAMQLRSDLKAVAGNHPAHRTLSSKLAGRSLRPQDQRPNKFELMGTAGLGEEKAQPSEQAAASRVLVYYTNPGLQNARADMPLPTPPTGSEPAKTPERAGSATPLPAENPYRQAREPRAEAATPPPKLTAHSYYVEKIVEHHEAGQVKVRYRRQSCEPPNMPDVCFMPQANRRGIVVERR